MLTQQAKSGDPCQRCGHKLIVVNTVHGPRATVRYLGCRRCGWRPEANKLVTPYLGRQ